MSRPQQIDEAFRTNVFAMYYLCQAAVAAHEAGCDYREHDERADQGRGPRSMLIYAATKGAIASLTIALSNLLAPQGIRVNCVAPGPVWTPIQPIAKTPEALSQLGSETVLGAPASRRSWRRPMCCSPRTRAAT